MARTPCPAGYINSRTAYQLYGVGFVAFRRIVAQLPRPRGGKYKKSVVLPLIRAYLRLRCVEAQQALEVANERYQSALAMEVAA